MVVCELLCKPPAPGNAHNKYALDADCVQHLDGEFRKAGQAPDQHSRPGRTDTGQIKGDDPEPGHPAHEGFQHFDGSADAVEYEQRYRMSIGWRGCRDPDTFPAYRLKPMLDLIRLGYCGFGQFNIPDYSNT